MTEPKTFASLSPSLLARKGAAKPAMRPQLLPMQQFHEATARELDIDTNYSDFGDEHEPVYEAEVVEFRSSAQSGAQNGAQSGQVPHVVQQQHEIAARVRARESRPAKPRQSALSQGRNAAFTLRLDADRHLKLRLACTLAGRSAQQLVTEALDSFIASLPDVAELAARLGKSK